MIGYTKLFSSILMSTIWREDDTTRILFITMLAMKDSHHRVWGSVPGLADMARIPIAACRAGLAKLMAPDPDSSSVEFEGRRIKAFDGGWIVLNGEKYRQRMNADERRQYCTGKQAERRERLRQQMSTNVNRRKRASTLSTQPESEPESESEEKSQPTEDSAALVPFGDAPTESKAPKFTADMEQFWNKAPKIARERSSKIKLFKFWQKLTIPEREAAFDGLETWIASHSWTKDGGNFIPGIHRFISERKFDEEPAPAPVIDTRTEKRKQWDAEIDEMFAKNDYGTTPA